MEAQALNNKHIIMLPYMAQGHLIPFLELAYKILDHNPNFTITIASSPLNIEYLRSAITNTNIHLKSLPFNSSDHGLPPNTENTDALPPSQIIKLLNATTALEAPFRNTVEELETLGLDVLRNLIKLHVWCIGPLIPSKMLKKNLGSGSIGQRYGKQPVIQPERCIEWLDSHPTRSVLYISFGSQNTINEVEMMELAKGLEDSKRPFIWVIR